MMTYVQTAPYMLTRVDHVKSPGRPPKYKTEEERIAGRKKYQHEYYMRGKTKTNLIGGGAAGRRRREAEERLNAAFDEHQTIGRV